MESPKDYSDYFQQLVTEYPDLLGFVHAPVDTMLRLLSDSRSNLTYPALMLESASFHVQKHSDNNLRVHTLGAFLVLVKSDKNDFQSESDALIQSFDICNDILSRLRKDSRQRLFHIEFINDIELMPIAPLGPDYLLGYRVEIEISSQYTQCYDHTKWTN